MTTTATVFEPDILTANTYFWTPAWNASSRRSNERKRLAEVADFFRSIGMQAEEYRDYVEGEITVAGETITAQFMYSESCKNVYKGLSVHRDGKRSNITALRKLYQ